MSIDGHIPVAALGKGSRLSLEGRRSERSVILADGSMHTLALLHPGTYTLQSDAGETLRILAGLAYYRQSGTESAQELREGDTLVIPAQQSYQLEVIEALDYLLTP